MTMDHAQLRQLVLSYEDLTDDDRAAADAHLARCPACAGLRERLLAAEARGRTVAGLSASPQPLGALSDLERAQARASLAALQSGQRDQLRVRLRNMLPLALAAVAALVLLSPSLGRRGVVRELQVGSPLVLRGDASTPAAAEHGVSFRLTRPGYPVLVHVDGAGVARLLHPDAGGAAERLAAGQLALLPRPEPGEPWRSDLTPGCETYLLAIATERAPSTAALAALVSWPPAPSRDEAIRTAERRLGDLVGKVARRDAEGCH